MWIREMLMAIFGLCAGLAIAGAFAAFIALIGIFPRLALLTNTARDNHLYEILIMAGVTLGNLCIIFEIPLPGGLPVMSIFGLFGGIFVGCLAGALDEVLHLYPIISRGTGIRHGMPYILLAVAWGKSIGILLWYFLR